MRHVAHSVPNHVPTALIAGSGAEDLLPRFGALSRCVGEARTPFGSSSPLYLINTGDFEFWFLARHGHTGYSLAAPFVNYRANIWALKECGVERIVSWSGPGAIDPRFQPGQLVIPDDLIDETRRRASSFYEGTGLGFIRQSPVFCQELRSALLSAGGECHDGGVYVCTEGPRLETPAEIRKYALYGGQLVGMTLAPECFLARELEICYAAVCYVTNYAEGVRPREHQAGVLFEGLLGREEKKQVAASVRRAAECAIAALAAARSKPRECPCSCSMERYRRDGRIGEDWHTWIAHSQSKEK